MIVIAVASFMVVFFYYQLYQLGTRGHAQKANPVRGYLTKTDCPGPPWGIDNMALICQIPSQGNIIVGITQKNYFCIARFCHHVFSGFCEKSFQNMTCICTYIRRSIVKTLQ